LAAGHLVRAHMQHNRSAAPSRSTTPAPMTPVSLAMTNAQERSASTTSMSAAAIQRSKR
jgi:hydroxymethylglutaryl-CoA reductase (NADPH)